jgi:O-antigen/teichoic acid export membrane protein
MKSTRNFSIYLAVGVWSGFLPFFLVPILTQVLTPSEYGQMATTLALVGLLSPVVAWGMNSFSQLCFVQIETELLPGYLGAALFNAVVATLLLMLAFTMLAPLLEAAIHVPKEWVRIAPMLAAATILPQLMDSILTMQRRPFSFGVFEISNTSLNFVLVLVLVVFLALGWTGRVYAAFFANLTMSLVALFWLVRLGFLKKSFDFKAVALSLRFGAGVVPSETGSLLIRLGDRLLVAALVGQAAAGHYAVAAQLSVAMQFVIMATQRVWTPYLFNALENGTAAALSGVARRTYLLVGLFLASFAAINLALPTIYQVLVAVEYHDSITYVFWLTIGYFFNGVATLFNGYIVFYRKTHILSALTLFYGLIYVAIATIFVDAWQAKGVAIAFAVSSGLVAFVSIAISHRIRPMAWLSAIRS